MRKYTKPYIEIAKADLVLLNVSGPGATDIDAPSFDAKESVWDEEEIHYYNNTNKEENYGEDWI